jgi:methionine-rich copper-binding protein CopC
MRRLLPFSAALLAIAAVTSVFAHAEPATVQPGDGAVLAQPPTEVVIEMTQEMARQAGANDIEVFDPAARKITTVSAVIDNSDRKRISVPLPSGLAVGTYTVRWKTLSADDGDAANGQISFTFDPSKPASPGKENLVEVAAVPTAKAPATDGGFGSGGGGTSWVLLVAVAAGMLALGSGGTFLLVRKNGP